MPDKPSKAPTDSPEEQAIQHLAGNGDGLTTKESGNEDILEVLEENEFELVDAPDDKLIEELDLDLARIAGNVIEYRSLQGNILAKVEVEENNLGIPKGVYLVLKIKGKELLIYGSKHAGKLNEGTINMIYQDVDSTDKFLEGSAEFKEGRDMDQQDKLDKFKKEVGTIGGIILKYRFLQGNLLSLIKIDRAMHEAAFEVKTDPKLLQRKLIERGEKIDCMERLRDGIYVIFIYGETRTILGGDKDAHELNPKEVKTTFEKSKNPTDFFNENVKAKAGLKDLKASKELAEQERKLAQILAELDEPITEEGEVPEIPEDIDEEELDKLTEEIDGLVNGKEDD